jgi:hypothetical protein
MKKIFRFNDDRRALVTREETFAAHERDWRRGGPLPRSFSPKFFITTGHSLFPIIEICTSWRLAIIILGDRLRLALEGETTAWIPILVGPPEEEDKMLESVVTYGGWISSELCCKNNNVVAIGKVRDFIDNQIRPLISRSRCVSYRDRQRLIRETEESIESMQTVLGLHEALSS